MAVEVTPVEQPTMEQIVANLTPEQHLHWRKTGEVPEPPKTDVTSDSSPDTPSETPLGAVENEAASEPADEQPTVGETPEQKAERKRRNDARRLRQLGKVEAELAAERRHREVLEKQLAESKGASAPPKSETKPVESGKPKRPRMKDYEGEDGLERYEADLDKYEDLMDSYRQRQVEERFERAESTRTEAERKQTWEEQLAAERKADPKFDEIAFNPKVEASDSMLLGAYRHEMGAKIFKYLGQHPEESARIARRTDIPGVRTAEDFAALQKKAKTDAGAAKWLARAEAIVETEFDRIAESLKAAPTKTTARTLPKPTAEVSVEPRGSAAVDEEEEAVRTGNQEAFNRIRNRKELERLGVR